MIYQHPKFPIIHFITAVFILVIQNTLVSAQNFNDPEAISAWNITTQSPIETKNASVEQGLDSWNIQQAIALAAAEEASPSSPAVEEVSTSVGNSGGGGGGRLGTANYSLRNRSELVTIARNIAKAKKEASIQHASAPTKDAKYTETTSKTFPDQEILEDSYIPEIKTAQKSLKTEEKILDITVNPSETKQKIAQEKNTSNVKRNYIEEGVAHSPTNVIESIEKDISEKIIIDEPSEQKIFPLSSSENIEKKIILYNKKIQQKKYRDLLFSIVEIVLRVFIVALGIMILIQKGILSKRNLKNFFQNCFFSKNI